MNRTATLGVVSVSEFSTQRRCWRCVPDGGGHLGHCGARGGGVGCRWGSVGREAYKTVPCEAREWASGKLDNGHLRRTL